MIAEFSAAISSARGLLDLAKAANGVVKQADIAAAVYEINEKLLAAQSSAFALFEENVALKAAARDHEEKARQRENWSTEAEKYALRAVAAGVFAYLAKNEVQPHEAAVKLCSNCFGQQKKSVLQQTREATRTIGLECHGCKAKVVFAYYDDSA